MGSDLHNFHVQFSISFLCAWPQTTARSILFLCNRIWCVVFFFFPFFLVHFHLCVRLWKRGKMNISFNMDRDYKILLRANGIKELESCYYCRRHRRCCLLSSIVYTKTFMHNKFLTNWKSHQKYAFAFYAMQVRKIALVCVCVSPIEIWIIKHKCKLRERERSLTKVFFIYFICVNMFEMQHLYLSTKMDDTN